MRVHHYLLLGAAAAVAGLLTACASSGNSGNAGKAPVGTTPSTGTGTSTVLAGRPAPASAPPAHAGSTVARTAHHTFAPYDASGRLTAAVSGGQRSGNCWTTSIAVPIAGVYRCFAGNEILDPCFAPAAETSPPTVACFADPWHPGTLLTLRRALPKDDPQLTDGHPWALELANRARCVDITGVVPRLAGVDLEYRCGPGLVAGFGAAATDTLTARYGPMHGPLHSEQILAEWRGRSYHIGPGD
jgi:hypothetical protein